MRVRLLTESEIRRLHVASLSILERVGVQVPHAEMLRRFAEAVEYRCVLVAAELLKHTTKPITGEDARVVLEVIFAAYESARTGRKVELPFASTAARPIDLWKPNH
jgi:predicted dehydrogenase